MEEWTSETLFRKAIAYCKHAFSVDPNGNLFPLLASLALEMLGKAALAHKHPALIAEHRDDGRALLYAFGISIKGTAHTIPARTVFSRLRHVVESFTDDDENACLLMAERRNRELHTGEFAYAEFKSGQWLPSFYRVTRILCEFMERDLKELLGPARAEEASEIIDGEVKRVHSEVNKRKFECRARIEGLRAHELEMRRKEHEPLHDWSGDNGIYVFAVECPVCNSIGRLALKEIAERAEIVEDRIFVDRMYSPKRFECGVCDFKVEGWSELMVMGMADQITRTSESDPAEFFEMELKEELQEALDGYDNE